MTHLGDITKISGCDSPIVDCIIGGSPCQDLSIAGKRAGLAGERSGLFMEQIRIIKEMRAHDRASGRTGNLVRPRFLVWENVAGALSSCKGEDFRAVLEELARVTDENAVVPQPPKGKWATSGCIMGDGFSIAWRILDAQFWGVPQRRRRIALVADFGGHAAPEILFVRKSVCGDTAASGDAGQGAAGGFEDGFNPAVAQCLKVKANLSFREDSDTLVLDKAAVTMRIRCGCEGGGKGALIQVEKSGTLATSNDQTVFAFSGGQGTKAGGLGIAEECAPSLKAADSGSNRTPVLCMAHGQARAEITEDVSPTRNCNHEQTIIGAQAVRRLTPLECERLQGYPDGWTDIGAWTDCKGKLHKESSDSARYKALGNSIALPPWKWVLKRLCACYERDATMASLFDGIGGFPLIWEQLNGRGSCLWASEIEEFPMAVTRVRFGE